MGEILSDENLSATARTIDGECFICHFVLDQEGGQQSRTNIKKLLDEVGNAWDAQGAAGTRLTNALKDACDGCLARGRREATLTRLSAGIKLRLPERMNQTRTNSVR